MKEFYINSDGTRLHAKLDRPDGAKKGPLCILIHGFTGHIYSIKDSDIYVPIKNDNPSLADYYGGNQGWFKENNTSWWDEDKIIGNDGCGLIAAINVQLYWVLQGLSSDSLIDDYIHDIINITKDDFMNYTKINKIFYYDNVLRDIGIIAPFLSDGLNNYCKENNISFESDWKTFFANKSYEVFEMIENMLAQSIPVIFGIGPGSNDKIFFYNIIPETDKSYDTKADNRFQFEVVKYYLTDDDGNFIKDTITGKNIEKEYNIEGHYMTITELIEDKDKHWLKVQTWGKYYYIDYDEWVDGQGWGLLNSIINITKEKD